MTRAFAASVLSVLPLALLACSSTPARRPTTMEEFVRQPAEPQHVVVPQNGVKLLVVGKGTALCTTETPGFVEVWGTADVLTLVGRRQGQALLHIARPGKEAIDVLVEVVRPDSDKLALAVGEVMTLPVNEVTSWSESGPGVISVAIEGAFIVVRATMPGTNVVVFTWKDGTTHSVEFTVVGGQRQL